MISRDQLLGSPFGTLLRSPSACTGLPSCSSHRTLPKLSVVRYARSVVGEDEPAADVECPRLRHSTVKCNAHAVKTKLYFNEGAECSAAVQIYTLTVQYAMIAGQRKRNLPGNLPGLNEPPRLLRRPPHPDHPAERAAG